MSWGGGVTLGVGCYRTGVWGLCWGGRTLGVGSSGMGIGGGRSGVGY